jgi:hypothetical protein
VQQGPVKAEPLIKADFLLIEQARSSLFGTIFCQSQYFNNVFAFAKQKLINL